MRSETPERNALVLSSDIVGVSKFEDGMGKITDPGEEIHLGPREGRPDREGQE
jgi:hypothetical protein